VPQQHMQAELFLSSYFTSFFYSISSPISVAVPSKAWVYGRLLAGIVGSNPAGGMDVCVVLCVVR
jgi:hypothetical protein